MSNFPENTNILESRRGLYMAWIRAHEGPDAPLVSVWIDPDMTAFEECCRGPVHDPSMTSAPVTGLNSHAVEQDECNQQEGSGEGSQPFLPASTNGPLTV
jgi:hypothetical protein